MKKALITLSLISMFSSVSIAETYNAIITKEHTNYKDEIVVEPPISAVHHTTFDNNFNSGQDIPNIIDSMTIYQDTERGSVGSFSGSSFLTYVSSFDSMWWWDKDYTIEYYAKINDFNSVSGSYGNSVLIGYMNLSGLGNYWSFGPTSSNTIKLYAYSLLPNSQNHYSVTVPTMNVNKWYKYSFSHEKSTGIVRLFLDDVKIHEQIATPMKLSESGITDPSVIPFSVGNYGGKMFNGYIEDIIITHSVKK